VLQNTERQQVPLEVQKVLVEVQQLEWPGARMDQVEVMLLELPVVLLGQVAS
jgi:hypothetical protein